jgi:exopolysaccharide biosynthesis polyprenyl glycosylphosphotransferase
MLHLLHKLAPGRAPKLNLAGDCALLILAALIATESPDHAMRWGAGLVLGLVAVALWIVAAYAVHQYDVWKDQGLIGDLALTSVLALGVSAAVAALAHLAPARLPAVTFPHFVAVLWPGALWLRTVIPGVRAAVDEAIDVVIVGAGLLGRHTGLQLRDERSHRVVAGYLALPGEPADARLSAPVLGEARDLERLLAARAVDEVYIAGNALRHGPAMQEAIRTCERFGTPFALPASEFRFGRARPASAKAIPDGYVHYLSVENKPSQMVLKRVFDIAASSVALALLSPLLLGVALAIKLTSPGPVFFKQERVGRHGRLFNMIKFRSMVANAEALQAQLLAQNEQSGPVFKIARDPRITAVGRVLRKLSLDELPQLLNVLRGEMSLVGPRPPLPSEVARYEPWQRRRLSVAPGITCVWQVSGRNQISFEQWMYLDMQYIDHWSLGKDVWLILKTIPAVLGGRGAS